MSAEGHEEDRDRTAATLARRPARSRHGRLTILATPMALAVSREVSTLAASAQGRRRSGDRTASVSDGARPAAPLVGARWVNAATPDGVELVNSCFPLERALGDWVAPPRSGPIRQVPQLPIRTDGTGRTGSCRPLRVSGRDSQRLTRLVPDLEILIHMNRHPAATSRWVFAVVPKLRCPRLASA